MNDKLLELLDVYKQSIYDKDIQRFMSIYSERVKIFDLWEEWHCSSKLEWESTTKNWFDALLDEKVEVAFLDPVIHIDHHIGSVFTIVVFTEVNPNGHIVRQIKNRLTWVVEKLDDRWCVIHEHTSIPACFDTGKLITHP